MEPPSEFEMWKQGVSRATAFTQSNATLQIQIAGLFVSAIVVAVASMQKGNEDLVYILFIPILSMVMLMVAATYFNFLVLQQTFTSLFGRRYEENQKIICHEELADRLRKRQNAPSISESVSYLLGYDYYSTPYVIFFWIYLLAPQASFWAWTSSRTAHWTVPYRGICAVAFFVLQVGISARLTRRAWKCVEFERQFRRDPASID